MERIDSEKSESKRIDHQRALLTTCNGTSDRLTKNQMTMSKSALNGLDPLKDLLGDVLSRLEALEAKVGIKGSSLTQQASKSNVSAPLLNGKSRKQRRLFASSSVIARHRFLIVWKTWWVGQRLFVSIIFLFK